MADIWTPVRKLGLAISPYKSADHYHIQVSVGDALHIVEEEADWYRCVLISDRNVKGILPKSYVHIKECIPQRIGNLETVVSKDGPILLEITSVVREWWSILKDLLRSSQYSRFKEIRTMILDLASIRRDLMSTKLTMEEQRKKQLQATSFIDQGNMILNLDLTVRDSNGEAIKPDSIGPIKLYREHKNAVKRLAENANSNNDGREVKYAQRQTLNLFVSVRNVVCRVGDDADVILSLYDVDQAKTISENYVIRWGRKGLPKDLDSLNSLRVLFTDLGSRDLRTHRPQVYLIFNIIRIGGMNPTESESGKIIPNKQCMRRPFGVAALDVTEILNGQISAHEDKQHFVPLFPCVKDDSLESVIKEAVKTVKEVTQNIHKGQGIWVNVRLLDGDSKQVKEDYPHLIASQTCIARKIGFPEVIMPTDVRNDFYITLNHGCFCKDSSKFAERNIEVVMQICGQDGQPLEELITIGWGSAAQSEYKSVVYRHQDSPRWFETFKISVPYDEDYNYHLKFIYKHKSEGIGLSNAAKDKEREFAISYVTFISRDRTTVQDGEHNLLVYSVDTRKSIEMLSYLNLPATQQELERDKEKYGKTVQSGPYTLNKKDSFSISTLACSTKLTQNSDLLGLLNWRNNPENVPYHLEQLVRVDSEEIVKFLQDTLDALFSVLTDLRKDTLADSENINRKVFDAVIFVIGLIGDRKYTQFKSVLEHYIKGSFSATLAHQHLISMLKHYINNVYNKEHQEQLFKIFRTINYLLKFIIRSHRLFSNLNADKGQTQYENSMKQIFQSINKMMSDCTNETLKIQGAALKYIPAAIPDLIESADRVMDAVEFSEILVEFIHNVPANRLTTQKLTCLQDIINSPLIHYPESRKLMLEMVVQHVGIEIISRSSVKDTRKTNLELCANIISDILHHLHNIPHSSSDIHLLFQPHDLLRTIMKAVIDLEVEERQQYVVILIAILDQMTERHYKDYQHILTIRDNSNEELSTFLKDIIMISYNLIKSCVFDTCWNEMVMVQSKVIYKALRHFSVTIKEKFSFPFEAPLWKEFFQCAISFLLQDALQLEMFSSDKRRKIIASYGDMRRMMAFEIRSMWFNLGDHKLEFIPELTGKFLEMTFVPETELRKATLPLFFDMMIFEFEKTQSFSVFSDKMIEELDKLIENGRGDEQYVEMFYKILRECCSIPSLHQIMKENGLRFVELARKLMMRLFEYRAITNDESMDNRMSCIVNLLNFYRNMGREEMYITYIHKLYTLHISVGNHTEAASTLLLYTNLIQWTDEILTHGYKSSLYQDCITHRQLKEQLYKTIIDHFNNGLMWEKARDICKELINHYEHEMVDYSKLPGLLKTLSETYNHIITEHRTKKDYYRVAFYGNGYPSFLSNKVFVYRGKDYEKLGNFNRNLMTQFPNARLLQTLEEPGKEITESTEQYLQISDVKPVESSLRFEGRNVSQKILNYYSNNDVDQFTHSKRISHCDDVTKLWIDRTILRIEAPLPGILRWFPVIEETKVKVSPIQNAIETLEGMNLDLRQILSDCEVPNNTTEKEAELYIKNQLKQLSLKLNGNVDPAVNGGLMKYKLFYDGSYLKTEENPNGIPTEHDINLISELKNLTSVQLGLLSRCLEIFNEHATDDLRDLNEKFLENFKQLLIQVEVDLGVAPPEELVDIKAKPRSHHLSSHQLRNQDSSDSLIGNRRTIASDKEKVGRVPSITIFNKFPVLREKSPSKGNLMKNGTRNSGRVNSNYSTDSKDSGDSGEKKNQEAVVELTQQLMAARPLRPDSSKTGAKSRPASGVISSQKKWGSSGSIPSTPLNDSFDELSIQMSSSPSKAKSPTLRVKSTLVTVSSYNSDTVTSSEVPPPLPEKTLHHDYGNLSFDDRQNTSPRVTLRQNSHKGKPPAALPKTSKTSIFLESQISGVSESGETPPPIPEKRSSHKP